MIELQVKKSSGFFSSSGGKSDTDIARIKATVMLSYGYVALYSPADLITSRIEVLGRKLFHRTFQQIL